MPNPEATMSGQRLAHFLRNSVQSRNWMTVPWKGELGVKYGDLKWGNYKMLGICWVVATI